LGLESAKVEKILPLHLQEVIFSSSNSTTSKLLAKLVKGGKLRKIAPRIYTPNFEDSPETIVRRNLYSILGHLYPGAVLSHRSALEFQPTSEGNVYITYLYNKNVHLPGVTLRFMQGPGPIPGDNRLSGELYAAQTERALLENLQVSRQRNAQSKTWPQAKIEEKLEGLIRVQGESGLNSLRDKARVIATQLKMEPEFEKLNKLIRALLSTYPSKILTSPLAVARTFGLPFDPVRISLFEKLFIALKELSFEQRPDKNTSITSYRNFGFFEAYFSNYIEGTEFELNDAKKIITSKTPMPSRNEDSHDILGTYKLVSNRKEMQTTPQHADELLKILLYRHQVLMGARASMNPGQFKDKNNRAGETFFVDHSLVRGTLTKGFDFYQVLEHPFAKATYVMFLVSEVHPFLDGNGRVARIMMNAELSCKEQVKIIIPTVYRDDYVGALRRLSRRNDPSLYIRVMHRAWEFSSTIFGEDMDAMEKLLEKSNAFKEPNGKKLII